MKTSISIKKYYDSIAHKYDYLYEDALSKFENEFVGAHLVNFINQQDKKIKVLDLGCGTGLGLELLKKYSSKFNIDFEYFGIDISEEMIENAKSKWKYCKEASFFSGDMCDLSCFESKNFDIVISLFGSFSHGDPYNIVFDEVNRVLKSKGKLYIMTYSRFSLRAIRNYISTLDKSSLDFKGDYNVRNNKDSISCKAYFYSKKILKRELLNRSFNRINCIGLNACLELPLLKRFFKNNAKTVRRLLMIECKLLKYFPNLGHSLICMAEKK